MMGRSARRFQIKTIHYKKRSLKEPRMCGSSFRLLLATNAYICCILYARKGDSVMNISEAAKISGLTAATLRYYESEGLIPPVTRKNGGVRDYQKDDLGWIDFIKCMRSAGMSVESLIEYTTLFRNGAESDEARKNILIRERDQLIAKQKEISETIEKLNHKIQSFEGTLKDSEESLPH